MKILKDNMRIQDMKLKVGEVIQIGVGPSSFKMRYEGNAGRGKWDKLSPVRAQTPSGESLRAILKWLMEE